MAGELKSRLQSLVTLPNLSVPFPGAAQPLSATPIYVKSVIIQGLENNTDYVYVGDSSNQLHAIEPNRSLIIWGDSLDQGTGAQIDLSRVFVRSLVNNEGVSIMYLEGA